MHEYIHINEAVKKYNKTRQTFYNYIRKGLVKNKKVNNKLYLHIKDIEKVLSDYISISGENAVNGEKQLDLSDEKITVIHPDTSHTYSSPDVHQLTNKLHNIKDDILQDIYVTKQDILFESKNLQYDQEQKILQTIQQQQKEASLYRNNLKSYIVGSRLQQKRTYFWVGYACFILINMIITLYVL